MRYCIISDIHANLPALNAVINHSQTQKIDEYICLGDIVGYGPQPTECLNLVKSLTANICAGNHDYAAVKKIETDDFNKYALESIEWTTGILSETDKLFLSNRLAEKISVGGFEGVHGALTNPVSDYMVNIWIAVANFKLMSANLCFNGHTHIPLIFSMNSETKETDTIRMPISGKIYLESSVKYIINAGSVGQPRDNDPRSSYLVFDNAELSVEYYRVEYDINSVQLKMRDVGLPDFLITRLALGK